MYSLEEIYKIASEVWSDPEDIAQFTAMAMGESGGRADHIAKPTYNDDGSLKNRGGDTGLWQIHPMHFDPNSSKYIKNVEDGHLNNDLVDLGIVSSYETAQQELLDPKINAQAADAIARRRDRYTGHTEGAFDWSAFPSSLFYGRRNQDFDLFLNEAREFGQGYAASKVAGSMIAPTPTFAKGLEPAVRTIVGSDMPIGPGKIGRGEISMLKKTLKGTIDFSSDIIEMLEKGLVAILPPEIISNIPKSALARVGLETDSKYPFFITPVGAKAFDIAGDIPGQLRGLIRSGISGIGNWFVEELGDGTNDPNV